MKSQIEECLEAEQAIFIVIGQAKERERSNFWWTCWWLDLTTWWWWWWWWLWTEKHLEFHLNCLTRLDLWKEKTILNACRHLYCHLREGWIWLSNIIVFFEWLQITNLSMFWSCPGAGWKEQASDHHCQQHGGCSPKTQKFSLFPFYCILTYLVCAEGPTCWTSCFLLCWHYSKQLASPAALVQ